MKSYVGQILLAIRVLNEKGVFVLIRIIITKLESRQSNVWLIISLILHEFLLILDERAIAYPSNHVWKIVDILTFELLREMPSLSIVSETHHGSNMHKQMMRKIYTYDGFVQIENDDVVVDVGAYVGGFSEYAHQYASDVVCIEPNEEVDDALSNNMSSNTNVTVVPKAAWGKKRELGIQKSRSYNENSLLQPDKGDLKESFNINADTVPNIVRELGFDRIDYLKIEAEGVEPEILKGALNDKMKIHKIAVDTSPERDGESTIDEVINILESYDYMYCVKEEEEWWGEYIVFAKSN